MRAHCVICSDQFIDDEKVAITALPCGHTFHGTCIEKWLHSNNSCPSCRNRVERSKVVWRLFFDCDADHEENTDCGRLNNKIRELQVSLSEKEKAASDVQKDNDSLLKKLKGVEKEKKQLDNSLRSERTEIESLKKQLQYYQYSQNSLDKEKEECRKIKRKFIEYQNIEKLLTGCEKDMQHMLANHRDGHERDVESLVKYVSMLKREYEKVKVEKKAIKGEFDKYKRENFSKDADLKECKTQMKLLNTQLVRSEEDLKMAEREKELLKKRVLNLQSAIKSPRGLSSAASIENLCRTPMLNSTATTPDLFNDSAFDKKVDVTSPCSPEILGSEAPKSSTNKRTQSDENQVKYLKISSASSSTQNPAKRLKREMDDISNLTHLGSFNIFKKKSGVGDYSTKVRTGFNGLGCVETFTQPTARPKLQVSKKSASRTSVNGKKIKVPSLPTLDGFINLE